MLRYKSILTEVKARGGRLSKPDNRPRSNAELCQNGRNPEGRNLLRRLHRHSSVADIFHICSFLIPRTPSQNFCGAAMIIYETVSNASGHTHS